MRMMGATLAALLALQPAGAFAQATADMEEVVVTGQRGYGRSRAATATKTDTPIKDVPASIQVIPRQLIEDQGAKDLSDVVRNIGGATQSSSSNYGFFNQFSVRGLNATFLRDGVPDGYTTNGYARTLTDVERVEVLRGPGSALYGSGAPGGTINLVSKQPTQRLTAGVEQTFGSFGRMKTQAEVSGPAAKGWLWRLDAAHDEADGFRGVGNKTVEVLPHATWRSGAHGLDLDFDFRDLDRQADPYGIPYRGTELLNVSREATYYTPFGNTKQTVFRSAIGYAYRPEEAFELRLNAVNLRRHLFLMRNAGGAIASATATTQTGRQLRAQSDDTVGWVLQAEPVFKVKTGAVAHTILTGAEYRVDWANTMRETANLPNITDIFNPVAPETSPLGLAYTLNFDRFVKAEQNALYAQDQMDLSERWKLRLGGRYDRMGIRDRNKRTDVATQRSDDRYSWNAGLVFQPVRAVSLYGGASRSHLANFSTESSTIGPPERATQFEAGIKTEALDGAVQADLAFFEVTRQDFLVTINGVTEPVGKQRTSGAELTVSAHLLRGWDTSANLALNKTRTLALPSTPAAVGKRAVGVPDYTAGLWTAYTLPDGPLQGLGAGAGFTARGSSFQDNINTKPIPGYAIGDAALFYRARRWEARFNVYNVTDAFYFSNGANSGALPGAPRTYQGSLAWRY